MHGEHAVIPVELEKNPGKQAEHMPEPGSAVKVPTPHGEHADCAGALKRPIGQLIQTAAEAFRE